MKLFHKFTYGKRVYFAWTLEQSAASCNSPVSLCGGWVRWGFWHLSYILLKPHSHERQRLRVRLRLRQNVNIVSIRMLRQMQKMGSIPILLCVWRSP